MELLALAHQLERLLPSTDDLRHAELGRFSTLHGAVEHLTVEQSAGVMHLDTVSVRRLLITLTGLEHLVLQTALSRHHAFLLLVGGKEFLAFSLASVAFLLLRFHHIVLDARLGGCVVHQQSSGIALERTNEDLGQDIDVDWAVGERLEILAEAATDVHTQRIADRVKRRLECGPGCLTCRLNSRIGHRTAEQHGCADECEGCQLVELLHYFTISSSSISNSSVELGLIGPAPCVP